MEDKEKKDDSKERAEKFVAKYGELVKEFDIDFATYPMFTPDGNGGFKIVVQTQPVDMKGRAQKSPFIK